MSPRSRPHAATSRWRWFLRGVIVVLAATLLWVGVSYARLPSAKELALLEKTPPASSALMRSRIAQGAKGGGPLVVEQQYVALSRISHHLQKAVVLAEDQKFWMHDGVDWGETRVAVQQAFDEGKLGRGGSTITQQLAKNLYLSERRSIVRKAFEWTLAERIDAAVSKKRILELYLNFAEWGDGVFGAEAAARHHFRKSALQLDAAEAAVLTAMLPSPLTRDPAHPTPNLRRRARMVAGLMARVGLADHDVVLARLASLIGTRTQRSAAKE
jgi:monofunctional biosynthetic peptidoglycan transglycosylase